MKLILVTLCVLVRYWCGATVLHIPLSPAVAVHKCSQSAGPNSQDGSTEPPMLTLGEAHSHGTALHSRMPGEPPA